MLDASVTQRLASLLAVGYQVNDEDFGRLVDLLRQRDTHYVERAFAALALGLSERREAVEPIASVLRAAHEPPELRSACATALQIYGGEEALKPLTDALVTKGDEVFVRASAATALGKMGDVCGLPALFETARAPEPEIRRATVIALGSLCVNFNEEETFSSAQRDSIAKTLTSAMIGDGDRMVRGLAAISLGQAGGASARLLLLRSLAVGSTDVKPAVAIALGIIGDKEASAPLTKILIDEKSPDSLRAASAIALGLLEEKGATKALLGLASDVVNEDGLRRAAVLALGMLRASSAIPMLVETLKSGSPASVAEECSAALALIGSPQSRAALRAALGSTGSVGLRVAILRNLGLARDLVSSPMLREAVVSGRGSEEEQVAGVQALGLIHDRSRAPDLAYYSWDTDFRSSDSVRENFKRYL